MNNNKDIGDIYRDAFKDYRLEPSSRAWENIEAKLSKPAHVTPNLLKNNYFVAISSVVIVAVIAFFVFRDINSSEEINIAETIENTSVTANTETEQIVVDEIIPQETIQDIDESETSEKRPAVIMQSETQIEPENEIEANKADPPETQQIIDDQQELSNKALPINNVKSEQTPDKSETLNNDAVAPPIADIQGDKNNIKNDEKSQETPVEEPDNSFKTTTDLPVTPIEFPADQKICKGEELILKVNGGITYKWSNGTDGSSINVNPYVTTIYAVTVTDGVQGIHYGNIRVEVYDCSPLFVPDAFTPDGDGLNDEFLAEGTDIVEFHLRVHSRTGIMIFETDDINIGWDGRINGKMAQPGVYFYTIRFVDSMKKTHNLKGHITLLR